MARTKLEQEIDHYLGLPYFINKPIRHLKNNALVGKGTWQEITTQAKILNPDFDKLSPDHKYIFLKKHHLGIDCSGLAYHLLAQLFPIKNFFPNVRHVSATDFTSKTNSVRILSHNLIQPGDLIRTHHGLHVLFIIKKTGNIIYYVHSPNRTPTKGVHDGSITITNPQKSLIHQSWSETIPDLPPASLHRLKCLTKND